MKYRIWSFNYRHASAGQKVLHRLCHELNRAGQKAYVSFAVRNPEWDTPYHSGPLEDDWIAVYPEIVRGNPWGARHVVRWLLNAPGVIGGDTEYDPSETLFYFDEFFNTLHLPPERLLSINAIETDIYTDRHLRRSGQLVYIGHGQRTLPVGGRVITRRLREDREALALALNRAEMLYSFDSITAMTTIARLCGCPVTIVADGDRYTREELDGHMDWAGLGWDHVPPPWDVQGFRERYLAKQALFPEQLARFIEITQAL